MTMMIAMIIMIILMVGNPLIIKNYDCNDENDVNFDDDNDEYFVGRHSPLHKLQAGHCLHCSIANAEKGQSFT